MSPIRIAPLLFALLTTAAAFAGPGTTDNHLKVDQFGYLPSAQKVAVVSNPQTGYNSSQTFIPGTTYQVRRWSDDVVVFTGAPVAWNGGATHTQSGDKVWRFDFSAVTTPGDYYVYDSVKGVGSYRFTIDTGVYNNVLKAAMRTFYYQRCGMTKAAPYAATGWTDAACHAGTTTGDAACQLYNSASTTRDLHGGWHDAGDYNKYVNFAYSPLLNLLLAYGEAPTVFPDTWGLPESGNGVPDLLDEVKYEIDWLLRMQQPNGSVLSVVGGGSASPPSTDGVQRKYGPATTSASFSAAAVFALAAIQYRSLNSPAMMTYGNTLKAAAVAAWYWAVANPSVTFYNAGTLAAGEQEVGSDERSFRKLAAAAFLYMVTDSSQYKTYVESNYTNAHLLQWSYAYPFEHATQDALLYYTRATGASSSVSSAIKNAFGNSVTSSSDNWNSYVTDADAYRAYLKDGNYTWGSNTTKGNQANMYLSMNVYGLTPANATGYRAAAAGYLHYLHGVNPTAFAYLSNMGSLGAENSVNEFYHAWFGDGSALWDRVGTSTYGPAPGFVTGGANPTYSLDACCSGGCSGNSGCSTSSVTPPVGQPVQKSYKDWNTSWPQNSWEITENAIYTQAAYVRLLSKFASAGSAPLAVSLNGFTAGRSGTRSVRLDWEVAGEEGTVRYEAERSTDGQTFETIGRVPATGRSAYTLMDEQPATGTNYYRIAALERTGTATYTPVRTVLFPDIAGDWQLAPNPARGAVFLTPPAALPAGILTVAILDATGRQVQTAELATVGALVLDVHALPTGIYTLLIQDGTRRVALRLAKE